MEHLNEFVAFLVRMTLGVFVGYALGVVYTHYRRNK